MTQILTSLYDTYQEAKQTVSNLESAGISHSDISIVANGADGEHASAAGTGAGAGAIMGGGVGLIAGLGMIAIPGLGPVVAAGWLVATAVGAVAGAASGGLIGGLVSSGVSEKDAHVYAEGVRRGGSIVTVRVAESEVEMARTILQRHRSVDVVTRRSLYEQEGWKAFDPEAIPYTPQQVAGESDRIPSSRLDSIS
jgi:hypothetical protein